MPGQRRIGIRRALRQAIAACLPSVRMVQNAPQPAWSKIRKVQEVPHPAHAAACASNAAAAAESFSTHSRIWLSSMFKGGRMRTTLSPAATVSSP